MALDRTDLRLSFYEWFPVLLVGAYFLIFDSSSSLPFILILGSLVQFTLNQWKDQPNRPVIYRTLTRKIK